MDAFAMDAHIQHQMLDSRIEKLQAEYDAKYAELQECAKSVKGFKIAGITTLAATGVGIGANIALHNKLKSMQAASSATGTSIIKDNRPQEDKDCAFLRAAVKDEPALANDPDIAKELSNC